MANDTLNNTPTTDSRVQTLNLAQGGQQGAMVAPHQWVSSANYVRQPIMSILVAGPIAMKWLDDGPQRLAALKALIELTPKRVEGLNSTVNWEFAETPVGNAGEMLQSVIDAKRERSNPSFTWDDKYGQAVARFWTDFGRIFMMDPDLGKPGIVASQKYIDALSPPLLPEHMSFTTLFFEPDETMTKIINAWLCTNMMPKTGGEIIGRKEIAGAAEVPEVSIEMTALTLTGNAVYRQALSYLQNLNLADLRPTDLRSFTENLSAPNDQGIDVDVEAATDGFNAKASDVVNAITNQ